MKKLSKIEALEDIVGKRGADYYLISTTDDFLNEYVPEYNMRLRWLTNFSGSNGIALISKKKKFFFTDGRYTLQAEKELPKIFEVQDLSKISVSNFISKNLKKKKIIVDTKIFSRSFMIELINSSKIAKAKIIHEKKNSIDLIWNDKPKSKSEPFFFLENKISGCSSNIKIKKIKKKIDNNTLIISSPESVCWLLNIRGYDLPNTPLVLSRLIISNHVITLYIDLQKVPKSFKFVNKIIIKDINSFYNDISKYTNEDVFIEKQVSYYIYKTLCKKNRVKDINDICKDLK